MGKTDDTCDITLRYESGIHAMMAAYRSAISHVSNVRGGAFTIDDVGAAVGEV